MRRHAELMIGIALLGLPEAAWSQTLGGDWWGVLETGPGAKLRLALHFSAAEDGKLTGTLDSLDQNAKGLPLSEVVWSDNNLSFRLLSPYASFAGSWDAAAKTWRGEWQQNGRSWPLALVAGRPPAQPPALPAQPPADWSLPADPEIVRLIDDRIASRKGVGMVVGVLDPTGQRIVTGGSAPAGIPFDGRTIFEIGSMSKVFTALMLADMVSKREVSLDDPAERYLPDGATMPTRAGRKITLRDLATHTSGLPRLPDNMPMGNPADPYADYSEKLLLAFLGHFSLQREIGSQFEYSNLGFGLLGYLLARAAHTDYETLLRQRITAPLRMPDTVVTLSPEQRPRFATGHDEFMRTTAPWTLPTLAGAGAIHSTAEDLLRFARAALDPHSPIAPAMKLATTVRRPMGAAGSEIGLAWIVSKPAERREILSHNGATGGFRAAIALDVAKGRGVVVLTNAAPEPAANDLAMHVLLGTPVLSALPIPTAPPLSAHTEVILPPEELDRVAGRYAFTPTLALTIERNGSGLQAQLSGQPAFPIFAEAPLHFFWRVVDAQAQFSLGPNGKAAEVVLIQNGTRHFGKRTPP
jgi:D-alanyl-D-alanine-carboxypeptidase/D-alanyl-D-alanine-endopeptidase